MPGVDTFRSNVNFSRLFQHSRGLVIVAVDRVGVLFECADITACSPKVSSLTGVATLQLKMLQHFDFSWFYGFKIKESQLTERLDY